MSSKDKLPSPPTVIDDERGQDASASHPSQQRRDISEGDGQKSPLKKAISSPPSKSLDCEKGSSQDTWAPPLSDEKFTEGFRLTCEKYGLTTHHDVPNPVEHAKKIGKSWRDTWEIVIQDALTEIKTRIVKDERGEREYYGGLDYVSDEKEQRQIWNRAQSGRTGDMANDYWPDLRLKIARFVKRCLPNEGFSLDQVGEVAATKARALSSDADNFAREDRLAKPFFTALTWNILCDNLFSPDCVDKWCDGPWKTLADTLNNIKGPVKRTENYYNMYFHMTRYMLARMHLMLYGQHASTERLVTTMKQELGPFMKIRAVEDPESEKLVDDCIHQVAKAAIIVDEVIVCNTFDIRITMHDPETKKKYGFLPTENKKIMEVRGSVEPFENKNDFPVQIVLSPLIEVFGKAAEGGGISHLRQCTRLKPMEVLRNEFAWIPFGSHAAYRRDLFRRNHEWKAKAGAKSRSDEKMGDKGLRDGQDEDEDDEQSDEQMGDDGDKEDGSDKEGKEDEEMSDGDEYHKEQGNKGQHRENQGDKDNGHKEQRSKKQHLKEPDSKGQSSKQQHSHKD